MLIPTRNAFRLVETSRVLRTLSWRALAVEGAQIALLVLRIFSDCHWWQYKYRHDSRRFCLAWAKH